MTIYCIDSDYGKKKHYVSPYSLKGTLLEYFGFDLRLFRWKISYYPWYDRFRLFLDRARRSHLSEKAAKRAADRLNDANHAMPLGKSG